MYAVLPVLPQQTGIIGHHTPGHHLGILMVKFAGFLALLIMVAAAGGAAYVALWDIPAPTTKVERTLPDSKFPR